MTLVFKARAKGAGRPAGCGLALSRRASARVRTRGAILVEVVLALALFVAAALWLIAAPQPRSPETWRWYAALPVGLASIYGGYFGAGLSVIILAALGLTLDDTLTRLQERGRREPRLKICAQEHGGLSRL